MSLGNRGGRPPQPTALKILRGNPGRRPIKQDEPSFGLKLHPAPKHLDATAKRKYSEIGNLLLSKGVVTEADAGILALYAQSWSLWVSASLEVDAEEKRQAQVEDLWDTQEHDDFEQLEKRLRRLERRALSTSPAVQQRHQERLNIDRYGGQLGLSPVMRAKLHVEPAPKAKDEMEELLSNG